VTRHQYAAARMSGLAIVALLFWAPLSAQQGPPRPAPGPAAGERPAILDDVGVDQRLDEPVPLDLVFRDEAGRSAPLTRFFGSRPIVLALVYYECPMLCSQVLTGLSSALRVLAFDIGNEFEVVTVSIDPRETPEVAAARKRTFIERYGRDGAAEGWHFLTGDEAAIAELARAVGFRYRYDPRLDQYVHGAAIMVLTPAGRLARYFYGIEYSPRDLRLGLVEAATEKIGSRIDQFLLFCYHYDPATGRYSALTMNLIRMVGALTLLALGTFMFVSWRRDRKGSDLFTTRSA
jgi:protein SCO1